MNMLMIIVMFLLSFIDLSLMEQILKTNIGQDVTLSCLFENASQFDQVAFMHQTTGDLLSVGLELFVEDSLTNSHMKLIRFSPNRLDLKIFSVNQNDSGFYTCMINDEELSSFLLEIFIPPRFTSYSPLEASVSYPEGSSMNLSCHAYAVPSVNISWIYRNKNKQSKTIHSGEDVYISSLESSDSGSYECIASNGYHATISRSFYVTVQYPPNVTINKVIDLHIRPIKLICQICSLPLSTVQWYRNEQLISTDQHFSVKRSSMFIDDEECIKTILTIYELFHDKHGRYECRAQNILGHYSDHIDFHTKSTSQTKSHNEHIALLILPNNTNRNSRSSQSTSHLMKIEMFSIVVAAKLLYSI